MKDMLEGDIAYMSIPDLLQWVDLKRKSCTVSILHGETGTSLYLDEGKIFYASSDKPGLRLGEFLVKCGLLEDAQVAEALSRSRELGIPFTRQILDAGLLSSRLLMAAFAELVDSILLEVFKYRSGIFSVTDPLPDSVLSGPIRLEPGQLDFASAQRLGQRERELGKRRQSLEAIREKVEKGEFQLPALPDMIMNLLGVMEDERSTFNDMVRIIITDQLLVSRVLKVANSPLYAAGEKVDSIHLALARMGMRSIVNIAIAFKIANLTLPGVPQGKLQKILDDAMMTAFLASSLARLCRLDPEEAFLGGLLHDLGKTVIYSLAPAELLDDPLFEELIAERHAEIGALIARKWNYPDSIGKMILYHHDCRFGGIFDRMVALVQLSDGVVCSGAEGGGDPEIAGELGLTPEDVAEAHRQAMASFRQAKGL